MASSLENQKQFKKKPNISVQKKIAQISHIVVAEVILPALCFEPSQPLILTIFIRWLYVYIGFILFIF